MKVDLTENILDLKGNAISITPGSEDKLTLREVLCGALIAPDNKVQSAKEKVKRFKLAVVLTENDTVEMDEEERVMVKDLVGGIYGSLIVGRVFEALTVDDE